MMNPFQQGKEQMTPFPFLKNFMKKKDANLQNQYYGGIVTWIYTLKLGDRRVVGRDKWRLATNNDKPLDVVKKMKIGFFSLYHHQSWQLAQQMASGRIIFHAVL